MTPYHVHYWVLEVHPRTAAIRSLDSVPLNFIVCYVFYPLLILACRKSRFSHPPPRSTLLYWTHSLPGTPLLLFLPWRLLARPLTPNPLLFPPLLPPRSLSLPSGLSLSVTTTAKTPARLADWWTICIGTELAASQ